MDWVWLFQQPFFDTTILDIISYKVLCFVSNGRKCQMYQTASSRVWPIIDYTKYIHTFRTKSAVVDVYVAGPRKEIKILYIYSFADEEIKYGKTPLVAQWNEKYVPCKVNEIKSFHYSKSKDGEKDSYTVSYRIDKCKQCFDDPINSVLCNMPFNTNYKWTSVTIPKKYSKWQITQLIKCTLEYLPYWKNVELLFTGDCIVYTTNYTFHRNGTIFVDENLFKVIKQDWNFTGQKYTHNGPSKLYFQNRKNVDPRLAEKIMQQFKIPFEFSLTRPEISIESSVVAKYMIVNINPNTDLSMFDTIVNDENVKYCMIFSERKNIGYLFDSEKFNIPPNLEEILNVFIQNNYSHIFLAKQRLRFLQRILVA